MQKYVAVAVIIILLIMIITRAQMLNKKGIKTLNIGNSDKKDYFIPPFALLYFYLIFANAFDLPTIKNQEIFHSEAVAWAGIFLCFPGLALFFWSLVSFRNSFRIGIDLNQPGKLITTGVFAYSRNPIYVALTIILIGQFLIFPSWILLLYIAAGGLVFHRQVLREEKFLMQQYGKEYIEYCKQVRRYL